MNALFKYKFTSNSTYSLAHHAAKQNKLIINSNINILSSANIWGWLNAIFNRVDQQRIVDVGPDKACAEWLLRCGASVKWSGSSHWLSDYNSLGISGHARYIEEIDATDSSIMSFGFPHFRKCKHIRRIVFHKATYLDDESLKLLDALKKSLTDLQITSCGNISPEGLSHLRNLRRLESLLLYDLPLVKDKEAVVENLQKHLPQCKISFSPPDETDS